MVTYESILFLPRSCWAVWFVCSLPQQEVMEQFTEDFANLEDDDEGMSLTLPSCLSYHTSIQYTYPSVGRAN